MRPERDQLWNDFLTRRSPLARQALVESYVGLVRHVVFGWIQPIVNANSVLEENDLMQMGMIGLLDAIERYDPTRGVRFETYAVARIRGAIQDQLRAVDWLPRSARRQARLSGEESTEAHVSSPQEMAVAYERGHEAEHGSPMALVERLPADQTSDIFESLVQAQAKERLIRAIERLETRDRLIITLYYYEHLTFKEIGDILHLSESRVFQIHRKVLNHLREELRELV